MSGSVLQKCINNPDLTELLGTIESFCEEVWSGRRLLLGFTDHGPNHSRRVIKRIEEFLANHVQELSEDEAFVLLAAAWLHDVCMQDYGVLKEANQDDRNPMVLREAEITLIRKEHASRLRKLLMQNSPITLLRDEDCAEFSFPRLGRPQEFVEAVAFGHSTEGFQEVKEMPDSNGPTGLEAFRFGLLAALLLLGDELDLDLSRVSTLTPELAEELAPITKLHYLKHRYVTHVAVVTSDRGPAYRHVKIDYCWPITPDEVEPNYRRWIEGKILQQINLVQPTIERYLEIRFDPARPFMVSKPDVNIRVEPFPTEVLSVLYAERIRMDLANLEDLIRELKDAIHEKPVHIFVETENPNSLGARQLAALGINELQCRLEASSGKPYRVLEIDAEADPTATDAVTLLMRIAGAVSVDRYVGFATSPVEPLDEESLPVLPSLSLSEAKTRMEKKFREAAPVVLLLHNTGRLVPPTKHLLRWLVEFSLRHDNLLRVLMTVSSGEELEKTGKMPEGVKWWVLPMIDLADAISMLKGHTLYEEAVIRKALSNKEKLTQAECLAAAEILSPVEHVQWT